MTFSHPSNGLQTVASFQSYCANRKSFPHEQLRAYQGEWIAWNQDGTEVIAHGKSLQVLAVQLEELSVDQSDVVIESIPPLDEVVLLSATLRYPILGYAGFLQYFDVLLLGHAETFELTWNGSNQE